MSENVSVEDVIELFRQPLLEIEKLDDELTFAPFDNEKAQSFEIASAKYFDMSEAALRILDKDFDPTRRSLLPLLQDRSVLVRFNTVNAVIAYFPQEARATLIQLAELEPRSEPELDITYTAIRVKAQMSLWLLQHGTIEGWAQAPESFWREQR